MALKKKIETDPTPHTYEIDLTYITGRGRWYFYSWKGDEDKSGGIVTNIGVHFFDMLIWIFGNVRKNVVHLRGSDRAAGYLELEKARVRWFLSLKCDDIPSAVRMAGKRTYRSIRIDGQELEFTEGFSDLHTAIYRDILDGRGFGIVDSYKAIETVHKIRDMDVLPSHGHKHPYLASGDTDNPRQ